MRIQSNTDEVVPEDRNARFVMQMTSCQNRLYAYICTVLGSSRGAADVLQEANLVLWQKADEYDHGRPFMPWAMKIAYYQVLAHRKKLSRDKLVFDDELLAQVDRMAREADEGMDERLEALDGCLRKLPPRLRELVNRKYQRGESVNSIAATRDVGANAVSAQLYRVRKMLLECVEKNLATEGTA